jgi:hypothetical protein
MNHAKLIAALVLVAFGAVPAMAEEFKSGSIVTGGTTTIVYVFPTSPQTFVPVAGLPSFLVMPGAPIPAVATEIVYSAPGPVPATLTSVNVDCRNFTGVVTIAGADTFNLDRDGDGIGCEPEDRQGGA